MDTFDSASTIVVSHASALSALRSERLRFGRVRWEPLSINEQHEVLSSSRPDIRALDEVELLRIGALSPEAPLEALVGSRTQRTRNPELRVHTIEQDLPAGSILRTKSGIYVASPALAVVQYAARMRSFPAVLARIYELCGTFTMPEGLEDRQRRLLKPTEPEPRLRYQETDAALTLTELASFLDTAPSLYGAQLARKAARHALEGARSPMEAITNAVYHTSRTQGGFGIAELLPNHKIIFNDTARAASGLPYAVCDAYLPSAQTTLEYNGSDHDSYGQRIHDERRAAGLAAMGIRTISFNDHQLRDIEALEAIAQTLYRFAGKRYRNRTQACRVKQIELLNGLRTAFGLKPC